VSDVDASAVLPPRMRPALEALAAGATPAGACTAASCSPATLRRWRARDDFAAALREIGRAQAAEAMSALLGIAGQAVAALADALTDGTPATKVRAARAVLELSMRFTDDDIDRRLSDIERRVNAWQPTDGAGLNGWPTWNPSAPVSR
jgi:hypothetical protein